MTPSNAYELLGELSRAIDDSLELEPMLQRFLTEMVRLLEARGGAVLESLANTPPGQAPIVCLSPDGLPRDPLYGAFWEDWSPSTLEAALAERPHGLPILTTGEMGGVLAARLPGFGLLILVCPATVGALTADLQQGLALVAMTLAQAARGARRDTETRHRVDSAHLARSQRIADIGREIRVPAKDILELSELTLHTSLEQTQHHYLHLIRSSTARLLGQIDELLDFARIETGQMTIEQIPFNPSVLIADLVEALATDAQRQGREIHYEQLDALPTHSQGDPGRIRQVLTTLWKAALTFGRDDRLCLQTRRLNTEHPTLDWIQFSALGLRRPLTDLQELIDPATAAGATIEHRFSDRSGWPLATCAHLVEHMGGRIWIDTQEPGSLHFTLPLPQLDSSGAPPRPLASWPGKRALLVDDQAIVRRTLAYWFRHWGFEVQEASTGRQALELARVHRARGQGFDVHVFDSMLPELDGFELATRLHDEFSTDRGSLVMLASIGQRGDAQRCREVGIDAFLTKPASPRELRELLTRLLVPVDSTHQERQLLTRHMLAEYRQRLRILLVESGLLHQKLASTLLQEWGHETLIVNSGGLAIEQFRSETYDLVFLDLYLPDVDGIEVARAMRRLEVPGARRTPIIGLSTLGLDSERERCLEFGLDEHIVKPLNPAVLEDLIQRFIRNGDEPLR